MYRVGFLLPLLFGLNSLRDLQAQSNSPFMEAFPVAVSTQFYELEFAKPKKTKPTKSIRSIRVLDYRPDTGRIGIYQYGFEPITEELKIRQGLSKRLENLMNKYLSCTDGELDLLIVLKECWVSNYFPLKDETPSEPRFRRLGVKMMIQFEVDIFERKEEMWSPFLRTDTVLYSSGSVYSWGKRKLGELARDLCEKLLKGNQNYRKVEPVSEELLHKHFQQAFNLPIYRDTSLKKGVYRNFKEFKNNKPSIEHYQIDSGSNYFMVLPKDENGVANISRKVWGYCDGTNIYLQIQAMYFPVIRLDNALYVYGTTRPENRTFNVPLIIPFLWEYAGAVQIDRKVLSVDGLALYRIDLREGFFY